ncbi:MAG: DUF4339 domain-containing protein [Thermoguttaceae bacterium]|nr:DUF4339 domain-containing protein [Thermoguttaceae bacterium]
MKYYVRIGSKAFGPFSKEDVLTLAAQNRVNRSDPVSTDRANWRPAGEFPELFPNRAGRPGPAGRKSASADSEMWYVSRDGRRRFGPCTTETVIAMLAKRELTPQSYVWKEGERPRPFRQESLFYLFLPADEAPLPPERPADPPAAGEERGRRRKTKGEKTLIRAFKKRVTKFYKLYLCGFFASVAVLFIGIGLDYLGAVYRSKALERIAFSSYGLAALSMLFSVAMSFVLVHRFWCAIQPHHASTTPARAVGFCFIPFFNLYWIFVCYFVLARDINAVLPEDCCARADEGNALTFCILAVIPFSFLELLAIPAFRGNFSIVIPFLFFLALLVQSVVLTSFRRAVFTLVEME